jgi:N-methylhydantoinase B
VTQLIRQPKVSELPPEIFDGVREGYVPGRQLRISPGLRLHREFSTDLDPITYEVIRHNLWNINEEHGATIQRISGSPVAIYAFDLNPTILTEDGEFVFFGPYMQYMSGVADTQVKWILEHRSDNPGIRDGDMFIANDPWVGAAHQMDVMLICPVFWQGELFCWVTNCLHQHDIGGITPGSFCPAARNVYDEGLMLPPTRIVEGNEIRRDIEELYLRASREPNIVALDLRAQIAGNSMARDRILALIRRYGPATIKGVMQRILANGERAFLEKMRRLPDGEWRERTYVECCRPGDRKVYPVYLTLRKQGDHLTFENEGTAPQDGAMNATYSGWRGSLIIAINQILCWDQYFAVGGALRHISFDPTPGTFTCARHPASVSTAPVQAMEISLYPTYNLLAKMVYADPELRKDIMCIGGTSQFPTVFFQGLDQRGREYGMGLIDPLGGAIGAFSCADGISTGGQSRTPISRMPNIEHTEQLYPMLILSRREIPDSGGAGKFRGGMSAEVAFIPHNTGEIIHNTVSSGSAVPTSAGLMGGYAGMTNVITFAKDTQVLQRFAAGLLAQGPAEIGGELAAVALRQEMFRQGPGDVFTVAWSAGAGFGDPLDRAPERVAADVRACIVTQQAAAGIYGVVIDAGTGTADHEATQALRRELRLQRLQGAPAPAGVLEGARIRDVTEKLQLRAAADGAHYCCSDCRTDLGPIAGDYKQACHVTDLPLSAANPLIGDPRRFVDADPVFRTFVCPGCGTMIDTEMCLSDDPPIRDIRLLA